MRAGGVPGTRSGQEAPEDRGYGETRTEGKAKEQSHGQRQRGQQGGICRGGPAAVFLRQGHMGLVIPLVTCGMTGDGRGRKAGHGHQDKWT